MIKPTSIQFRAWDPDSHIMMYEIGVSLSGRAVTSWGKEKWRWPLMRMRPIGGKEVYEGDIIEMKREDMPSLLVLTWFRNKELLFIKNRYYRAYITENQHTIGIANGLHSVSPTWVTGQPFKVVGNVFENPELIP